MNQHDMVLDTRVAPQVVLLVLMIGGAMGIFLSLNI